MQNDDEKTYHGDPDRNRKMQEIFNWSDREIEAEAAGKDLENFGKFKTGVIQAQDEFPEVFSNADLYTQVANLDEQLVAAGDKRPYLERYRDCCNAVLSGTEVAAQGGSTLSDEEYADVQALQMGSTEEAAQVLRKYRQQQRTYQQSEAEETDSDAIERMRQSRVPDAFRG